MVIIDTKLLTNDEEEKKESNDSLLNYEYDENDDGEDWET